MPDQQVMKAALQAYVDRTNAGDADGLLALFAPDAVMEDPVGTPIKQRAEMAQLFRDGAAYGARIDLIGPPRGSHGAEAAIAFDVRFTPPGSPRLLIRSLDVCTFDEDGLITSLRGFWGPEDVSEDPVTSGD
ncbi:nuclear transport factor 2 family protein [Sphingomonas jatrophae]|uniref:Steroid delta-isomerase n=1 Tax=Sphingomonas jatrophae TaxID=1166337 RepID=A0A1I6KKT9_9SPHN|nr:nuclear transport factor 2 family protein [Sphingomonas jatrophae]SFR91658.1 steroid delta-isomerase [Sphingomonas jatrophae]